MTTETELPILPELPIDDADLVQPAGLLGLETPTDPGVELDRDALRALPRLEQVKQLRVQGVKNPEIARILDVRLWQVEYEAGKLIRSGEINKRGSKYDVNDHFFEEMTPPLAYYLGLFAADGNLNPSNRTLTIAMKDDPGERRVLETLASFIGVKTHHGEFKDKDRNPVISLSVYRKSIYERMLALGFTPSNAEGLNFPDVPDEFLHHFVRGFCDGDGSIQLSNVVKDGPHQLDVIFANTDLAFLEQLRDTITEHTGISKKNIHQYQPNKPRRLYGKLRYHGNDAVRLCEFMYEDADLYLERKKAVFEKAVEIYSTRPLRKLRSPEQIADFDNRVKLLRDQDYTYLQIAEELDSSAILASKAASRLIARGEIEAKRRTPAQIAALDGQIKPLRDQGFPAQNIAEALGVSISSVENGSRRLMKRGDVERRVPSPEQIAARDGQVLSRIAQNLTCPQIAIELNEPKQRVYQSRARLIKNGLIEPSDVLGDALESDRLSEALLDESEDQDVPDSSALLRVLLDHDSLEE